MMKISLMDSWIPLSREIALATFKMSSCNISQDQLEYIKLILGKSDIMGKYPKVLAPGGQRPSDDEDCSATATERVGSGTDHNKPSPQPPKYDTRAHEAKLPPKKKRTARSRSSSPERTEKSSNKSSKKGCINESKCNCEELGDDEDCKPVAKWYVLACSRPLFRVCRDIFTCFTKLMT